MAASSDVTAEGKTVDVETGLYLLNKKNADCSFPVKFNFGGHEFVCLRDVFMPEDGGHDCFIDQLPIASGKTKVLEIGSGTGVITCGFYLKHRESICEIVATDINPQAVMNTKQNFEKHNVPGTVLLSDLFENLSSGEKFDLIFWNMPFFVVSEDKTLSLLERSVADAEYRTVERFINESGNYLRADGKSLLGFSPEMGDTELLHKRAEKNGKKLEIFWSGTGDCPTLKRRLLYELLEVKPI